MKGISSCNTSTPLLQSNNTTASQTVTTLLTFLVLLITLNTSPQVRAVHQTQQEQGGQLLRWVDGAGPTAIPRHEWHHQDPQGGLPHPHDIWGLHYEVLLPQQEEEIPGPQAACVVSFWDSLGLSLCCRSEKMSCVYYFLRLCRILP